ncbi:hypothetical protein HWI79_784 [Cryptosporidium felis]|nr:hypothetical protein HWI79_784 [Cryptosporidium felis]
MKIIEILNLILGIITFKSYFERNNTLKYPNICKTSLINIKRNAWDIVSENHEIFNNGTPKPTGELKTSLYKWNINYESPFSSQISQVILIVLVIIILICVVLGLVCCFYTVPKKEDFTKKEDGIYYFENENRPEEFIPIYQKNAQTRRYIRKGEIANELEEYP